jgi:hypothetical protein
MTKHTMTQQQIDSFGKKLETWVNGLPETERAYFAYIMAAPKELSSEQLNNVAGGAFSAYYSASTFTFDSYFTRFSFADLSKINAPAW